MSQRVETGLGKVNKSGKSNCSPVDAAECRESEDFNRIVTKTEGDCLVWSRIMNLA